MLSFRCAIASTSLQVETCCYMPSRVTDRWRRRFLCSGLCPRLFVRKAMTVLSRALQRCKFSHCTIKDNSTNFEFEHYTMPTLQASRQVDQVYPEVRNRLIESGDWDRSANSSSVNVVPPLTCTPHARLQQTKGNLPETLLAPEQPSQSALQRKRRGSRHCHLSVCCQHHTVKIQPNLQYYIYNLR